MPIYDRPVRDLVKQFVTEKGIQKGDVFSRESVIDWFGSNYPKIKRATITAHLMFMSTNKGSRIHHELRPNGQDDFLFQIDKSNFRLYNSKEDPTPVYRDQTPEMAISSTIEDTLDEDDATGEQEYAREFAYERDLKNYLSKNLSSIESGLTLYEDEGVKGIEFPVGGRFIDILANDKSGNLVVLELKVSRGYDRVIGQLLRYMGWIEKNLAETNQTVRGIIVASRITEDLVLATSRLHGVNLIEYRLSLEFKKIM